MPSSLTPHHALEQSLEAQQTRLRSQLPPLPTEPHAREVLMHEGWLATRWLSDVLAVTPAPAGPLGAPEHAAALADAVVRGLRFEQAFENTPHLDIGCDAQRVRVAQELVWARQSLAQRGLGGTPRRLLLDLVERAEDLFGDAPGVLDVATPQVEAPLTPAERRTLIKTFAGLGATVVGGLVGVLCWRTGLSGPAAVCLGGTAGAALLFATACTATKENARETQVSGR